jgi:DNA polymerase
MIKLAVPREVKENGEIVWWESEEDFKKLIAYCITDVEVEREAGKRLLKLSEKEKQIWLLDQKINSRGVRVDTKAVANALKLVEFEKKRSDEQIRKITDNAVATCTANLQLTEWVKSRGIETEGVAKGDVTELLANSLPDDVRAALVLRQESAKSSTAKLSPMLNSSDETGRVKGCFQYHAASTGRWGGRRVQFQNLPRPKLKQKDIENVFKILGSIE